jgi:protocatechuate 3,4-dioxygenase alpha subunit
MSMPSGRTPSQTVGPFFDFSLTPDTTHGCVFPDSASRIRLAVRVMDGAGDPVSDAIVEIWQACDVPGGDAGFGRLGTREDGSCEFDTVRPCDPSEAAAHINICLFARGLLRHLHTRLYFADDPRLASDPVLALVPDARRPTLIAERRPARSADPAGDDARPVYSFDIHLQGPRETVFFDV